MKTIFLDLIAYLQDNEESFYFDETFDGASLASEILAYAEMIEERIQ